MVADHVVYYCSRRTSEALLWRELDVVVSGPAVPGEGEQKIMDFIRRYRALPSYDANTRHCVYGLDADLILLALATHEPHFAILREKQTFRKMAGSRRALFQSTGALEFLYIGLLREYLSRELLREPSPGTRPEGSPEAASPGPPAVSDAQDAVGDDGARESASSAPTGPDVGGDEDTDSIRSASGTTTAAASAEAVVDDAGVADTPSRFVRDKLEVCCSRAAMFPAAGLRRRPCSGCSTTLCA